MEKFKPNLIPNNRDNKVDIKQLIEANGGIKNYVITKKKDGCRLEFLNGEALSRELNVPQSNLVSDEFNPVAKLMENEGIIIEGEFYSHGMQFNEIYRFFSNRDVTRDEVKTKLEKLDAKGKLEKEYNGRSIEWLTTFHITLKAHIFDGFIIGEEHLGYEQRMQNVFEKLKPLFMGSNLGMYIEPQEFFYLNDISELTPFYEQALTDGYEGLVLTHKDHPYKFGRNSLKEGTLIKMKDDKGVYDGIVLDVLEGTSIKDGIVRTESKLGYSKVSGCKEDREPSGMAKGFLCEYNGEKFTVSLKGFDNEKKIELLTNKEKYIGRHFKYTAMKPTKQAPRHAFYKCWRDPK